MNDIDIDRIWMMDTACRDCIRSVIYFNAVSGHSKEMWVFTQHCYGEVAAIQWCHLFNNYSDDTHFAQIFSRQDLPRTKTDFSLNAVRQQIWNACGGTAKHFERLRDEVTTFRNGWAAHKDMSTFRVAFPDIDKAMDTCLALRIVLRDFLHEAFAKAPTQKIDDLKYLLKTHDNPWLLDCCQQDARRLRDSN